MSLDTIEKVQAADYRDEDNPKEDKPGLFLVSKEIGNMNNSKNLYAWPVIELFFFVVYFTIERFIQ